MARFDPDMGERTELINYRYGGGLQTDLARNIRRQIFVEDSRLRLDPIDFRRSSRWRPRRYKVSGLIQEAIRLEVAVVLIGLHEKAGLGMAKAVNIWIAPRDPAVSSATTCGSTTFTLAS